MARIKLPTFHTTFGNYTATEIIDEGGAGRVYRVEDDSGQALAVKLLDADKTTSEKLRRFKNELFFCLKNEHPNIISIFDHGVLISDTRNSPFYVMPLFDRSLRSLITAGLIPEEVLGYFGQLLDGVEAAHFKKVVHRDLKPENILLDSKARRLVVADFGIAQFQEEALYISVETSANTRLANFQYAAPEQRNRGLTVDWHADIFALGLMLNEMYTREVPWGTSYKTITSVAPEYGYLDDIVSNMLRQSPQERPNSIEIVKQQLIGHKQEFIIRQRLSGLKKAVIPVTDIDDPLVLDPPRLVNFDYDSDLLTLFFQQPVNEKWIWALNNMGSHESFMRKGPGDFEISRDHARIRAEERQVQQIINYPHS